MLQLLWVLVLSTCALWAQNAAVSGSIVDSSGASIPKAKVTVRNLATNVAVATTTNSQGLFFLPPVAPGTYQLTATARSMPGFIAQLYAIDFRIPDAPGQGVYFVPTPGVLARVVISNYNTMIGIYVK